MGRLLHFSEDPNIVLFRPHVAPTSEDSEPAVWAIDEEHAPSYWFPRDCPRVCCWGGIRRLHAIEAGWLERCRACRLYAYEFNPTAFSLKNPNAGYWVAQIDVKPISIAPVGDLLARHAEAKIELRIVANLWPLIDAVIASGVEFSIIRKANALARAESSERSFFLA